MKIVRPNSTQLQTLKGIALILTGWLLLMCTVVFGGAAYGYLVDSGPTGPHGVLDALYIAAVLTAFGWGIWFIRKGSHVGEKARVNETTREHEVKQ